MVTPFAQVCISLIDEGMLDIEDVPFFVKQEVEEHYESLKGGDNQ